jgi:hypothetical protein
LEFIFKIAIKTFYSLKKILFKTFWKFQSFQNHCPGLFFVFVIREREDIKASMSNWKCINVICFLND